MDNQATDIDAIHAPGQRACSVKITGTNNCSALPAEIWAEILKGVDNCTFWNCRQLSHTIRAEADREFRISRLSDLSLRCLYRVKVTHPCPASLAGLPPMDRIYNGDFGTHGWGVSFSGIENERVHYKFGIICVEAPHDDIDVFDVGIFHRRGHDDALLSDNTVQRAITEAMTSLSNFSRTISVGNATQHVLKLDISIDWSDRTFSFNWKDCLAQFYGQETLFRRIQQKDPLLQDPTVATPDESEWLDCRKRRIDKDPLDSRFHAWDVSVDEGMYLKARGQVNTRIWVKVYQKYIKRAYLECGMIMNLRLGDHDDLGFPCECCSATHLCGRAVFLDIMRRENIAQRYVMKKMGMELVGMFPMATTGTWEEVAAANAAKQGVKVQTRS
ncbi:hypothetical protein CC80DRAFT_553219 [Byssothecium circinans]|uniref:F-box domain-containing protein n=1 Tax=Byssothecium circinans TaxID=147558 RepID=A0A6A5TRK5_9PLEO|nr:hypothetical protein CC80DRAFT_553219 [Byssothecium circinans]